MIRDSCAKIGFIKAGFVKGAPLKVRSGENPLAHIALDKMALAHLARYNPDSLKRHFREIAASHLAMVEREVEKLRVAQGEINPHALTVNKGSFLETGQLKLHCCEIAPFEPALKKPLFR